MRGYPARTETSGLRRRDQFLNEAATGLRHRLQNLNPVPQTRASFISNRSGIITYLCLYSLLFADFLYQEQSRKEN